MKIEHYEDQEEFYAPFTMIKGKRGTVLLFREHEENVTDKEKILAEDLEKVLDRG